MKKFKLIFFTLLLVFAFGVYGASAATVTLEEWAFNIDGSFSDSILGNPVPSGVNMAGFDTSTGLGTIAISITGGGGHNFIGFFDHDIDLLVNGYTNEFGGTSGGPASGQSWQIDNPYGTIYGNAQINALDNTNYIPASGPGDVSMALGWNFNLASGETALISLVLSGVAPSSGFYLSQTDPDSQYTFYYTGTLNIRGGNNQVPEPGTLFLLGSGFLGLIGVGRRKIKL